MSKIALSEPPPIAEKISSPRRGRSSGMSPGTLQILENICNSDQTQRLAAYLILKFLKTFVLEYNLDSASKLSQTFSEVTGQQSTEAGRSRNRRKGNPKKIVEMNYDDTGEVSDIDDITVMSLNTGNS